MDEQTLQIVIRAIDEASPLIRALETKVKALNLTRPDLDAEATIGIADVLRAREAWRQDAPAQYRELLDAKPEQSA